MNNVFLSLVLSLASSSSARYLSDASLPKYLLVQIPDGQDDGTIPARNLGQGLKSNELEEEMEAIADTLLHMDDEDQSIADEVSFDENPFDEVFSHAEDQSDFDLGSHNPHRQDDETGDDNESLTNQWLRECEAKFRELLMRSRGNQLKRLCTHFVPKLSLLFNGLSSAEVVERCHGFVDEVKGEMEPDEGEHVTEYAKAGKGIRSMPNDMQKKRVDDELAEIDKILEGISSEEEDPIKDMMIDTEEVSKPATMPKRRLKNRFFQRLIPKNFSGKLKRLIPKNFSGKLKRLGKSILISLLSKLLDKTRKHLTHEEDPLIAVDDINMLQPHGHSKPARDDVRFPFEDDEIPIAVDDINMLRP